MKKKTIAEELGIIFKHSAKQLSKDYANARLSKCVGFDPRGFTAEEFGEALKIPYGSAKKILQMLIEHCDVHYIEEPKRGFRRQEGCRMCFNCFYYYHLRAEEKRRKAKEGE